MTSPSGKAPAGSTGETLFARAARVFDGAPDPETGVRVLRVRPRDREWKPGGLATVYHQSRCFLDGGRRILLNVRGPGVHEAAIVLDLTTGTVDSPFPAGYRIHDVDDRTNNALLYNNERAVIYNLRSRQELAALPTEEAKYGGGTLLPDGRRAVISHYRGKFYDEYCRTHLHLLTDQGAAPVFLELDGCYANHMQGCPTEPDLFCYNGWPCPRRDVEGVASIATVDGRVNDRIPLDAQALRPGDFWGVRDHYVWTPDGSRIISYFNRRPVDWTIPFDHYAFDWWLSSLDWRTGRDESVRYPPRRWNGHMQMTPDSRYILCGGGPGFDRLYAVDRTRLGDGWNERILCSYPETNPQGRDSGHLYPYPFALPDGSGVIFNAGWWGPDQGVFLAEWPPDA